MSFFIPAYSFDFCGINPLNLLSNSKLHTFHENMNLTNAPASLLVKGKVFNLFSSIFNSSSG